MNIKETQMNKVHLVALAVGIGAVLMAEPSKTPQVRMENPERVQIMWQTENYWPLGGISICKSGHPESAREIWMQHDDTLNYYRGYDHWVWLTDLEGGESYEYFLLGQDENGGVKHIVESIYSFSYPDYAAPVVITGGPFITNPGVDSMSVVWRTNIPSGAAVDVRKADKGETLRFWASDMGILSSHQTQHVVHLTKLDEGTTYEYRPVVFDSRNGQYVPAGEWQRFTTLSTAKKNFRSLFLSDTHGDRIQLDKMLTRFKADACDFVLYGGDMIWSAMHAPDAANLWDEFLDVSVARFAGKVPLVMARGNHEGGGLYADTYSSVFRTSEGNTYQYFKTGDVLFVVLDSGDIHRDDRDCFPDMFVKQREWLENVLNSEIAKSAQFRIMVVHAPTHGMPDEKINERMRTYFADLLNEPSPEHRFQLCLGGHWHSCYRFNAGDTVNRGPDSIPSGKTAMDGKDFLYTVMLNGGPMGGNWEHTVMELLGCGDSIRINLFDGKNGELLDAIAVKEDGSVTELGLRKP